MIYIYTSIPSRLFPRPFPIDIPCIIYAFLPCSLPMPTPGESTGLDPGPSTHVFGPWHVLRCGQRLLAIHPKKGQ